MASKQNTFLLIGEQLKDINLFKNIVFLIILTVIVGVLLWLFGVFHLPHNNCKKLKDVYKDKTAPLNPISTDDVFNQPLYDFYIKTAYNAASPGNFKNSFVDSPDTDTPFCALTTCLKQGCRCLDFEIYSVNHEPVISTSSIDSNNIKETFNYLEFSKAMQFLSENAFSASMTPCFSDPLILNFRVMSNIPNNPIYPQMGTALLNSFQDRLLETKYNLMNNCSNMGHLPLSFFKEKVMIIIDSKTYNHLKTICPPILMDCSGNSSDLANTSEKIGNQDGDRSMRNCQKPNLLEFCNMHCDSPFLHSYRQKQLKLQDSNQLAFSNKTLMSMVLPNFDYKPTNFNPSLGFTTGCQIIGMSFQNFDVNLEYYSLFFNKAGYAFAYKPTSLRYIPVSIPAPDPYPKYTNVNRQPLIVKDGQGNDVNLINYVGPNTEGIENTFPFPINQATKNPLDFSNK
jgi:hypothetical protein